MSAAAQIRDLVDNAVQALTGRYEDRIKALEDKVAELEERLSPASAKAATSARRTGKAVPPQAKGSAPDA
jgi:hypothetical protein